MGGIGKDVVAEMNDIADTCIWFIKSSQKWAKDYEKYPTQQMADGYQQAVDQAVAYYYQIIETYNEAVNNGYLSLREIDSVGCKMVSAKKRCLDTFIKYGFDVRPLLED